ncbi:hypothetical protein [Sporosarcina beigongshangi]|nr:hypothetical protein [Sporosarcina beigongshangi]
MTVLTIASPIVAIFGNGLNQDIVVQKELGVSLQLYNGETAVHFET